MEVAQGHCVTRFRAFEAGVFDQRDPVIVAERVDDSRPDATAGGGTHDNQAIATEKGQIADQVGAVEATGLLLVNDEILRAWGDLRHDLIAAKIRAGGLFAATAIFPCPSSGDRKSTRLNSSH